MGAEYNKIADNTAVRLTLIVAGFGLWMVAAVGLMRLAFV